ncbi:tail fiber protein [Pectobacterium phage DU_PP_II]|uniref:Tail fiber protein n=1 Tax=Pectobacterium phage DU_PP_II TaxID=2041489 RepID=A0A2D2W669_9CAUD|nr:tail fiber protein [Pectobacterium phage DU_PP_II]ATS93704.1 tail fiber protein [Pectobacterium phage DU_PP_II]
MATNIRTVITYALDGSKTDFTIPFEYLARKFVVVTLIGVDRRELVLTTDYRFATKTVISTTIAWGAAQGYTSIEIRRFTSATERLVDFTDGSILRAYDLNVSQLQTIHVAEEARDMTAETIGVNNDGNLDARGRRIVNVADAVDSGDAINLGQVLQQNQNAWQARDEALGFRNEAEGFRNVATDRANVATQQAAVATDRANVATQQAADAEFQANRATQMNSEASFWNSLARRWASEDTNIVVENGLYSARHYAILAASYRDNAVASAIAASNEASRSKTEADRAKTEADKLGNWNALAGTIDSVSGPNVSWKGIISAPSVHATSNAGYILMEPNANNPALTPIITFKGFRGNPDANVMWIGGDTGDSGAAMAHGMFSVNTGQHFQFNVDGSSHIGSMNNSASILLGPPSSPNMTLSTLNGNGIVNVEGNMSVSGVIETRAIELGKYGTWPFIDFHSSAELVDYNVRVVAFNAPDAATTGRGQLFIEAGSGLVTSHDVEARGAVYSGGLSGGKLTSTGNIEGSEWGSRTLKGYVDDSRKASLHASPLRMLWRRDIGTFNTSFDSNGYPLPADASRPLTVRPWGNGQSYTFSEPLWGKQLFSIHSDGFRGMNSGQNQFNFCRAWGAIPRMVGVTATADNGNVITFTSFELMVGSGWWHFALSQDGLTLALMSTGDNGRPIYALYIADIP